MASSLINNTNQVLFDSVLAMDNAGMVAMFEALVESGLKGFLGCSSAIFKTALVEFFHNASVRDGMVVSMVLGKPIAISKELFSSTFTLPLEGLTDLHEGVKVNWGRLLFNIFKDMVTPGSRQARGYAVQICILLKNVSNLELGDSKEFPPQKVLTTKTVSRYIAINKNIDVEDVDDESRVKKTPVKKAASKKRHAAAVDEPVVKNTRTRVGKAAVVAKDSALVPVAQEAVPLQVVEPITAAQPPKLKRKAPKRKLKLPQGSEDEPVAKDADKKMWGVGMLSDDESMTLEEHLSMIPDGSSLPSTTGDVTKIQFGKSITIRGVDEGDWYKASLPKIPAADKGKAPLQERDPIKRNPAKEIFSLIISDIELLVQLREKVKDEVDAFLNSFSLKRLAVFKLEEMYAKEERIKHQYSIFMLDSNMIRVDGSWVIEPCADYWNPSPRRIVRNEILPQISYVDTLPHVSEFFKLLQKIWADVCIEAAEFFVSGKLLPVGSLNFFRTLTVVEPAQDFGYRRPTVTTWDWSQLRTAFLRYSLFGGLQTVNFSIFRSAFVSVRPVLGAASIFDTVVWIAPVSFSTAIFFDPDVQMDDIQHSDSRSSSSSSSEKWIFVASISRFISNQTKDSRRMGDSQSEVMSKINHIERALLDALSQQNLAFRSLIQSVRQEAHNQEDVLSIGLKVVRAQNAIFSIDLADIRKEVKAQKAELFQEMDERLATIRSELLDFCVKAQENHLNLSSQLGFLVDYINRGGDAKKGEVVAAALSRLRTIRADQVVVVVA
ncbi:filament-like plant protein 6 [Dorcoceras hygrometricum]|uniref:Filament-like plant protein 6 n=1 Tax=Dorcoceras hygrometricum TaxID=472368 RepID=A0A2Z7BJY1_9LAMI|nr:filament-like plant protein 6 [Dorcoceras hygrometricum]